MSVSKIFNWNESHWQSIFGQANLPHAMLFIGPAGIGKGQFADLLAARLLCEVATGVEVACGNCEGCHLLATANHPDFRKVSLEDESEEQGEDETPKVASKSKKKTSTPSTQIKIDQIRMLEEFVFVGSHRQGKRVIVIDPADAMNVAATNSLLKILEEPPSSVYFLLVSSSPKRLLPTLLSRCRQVIFGIPENAVASAWLKAEGVQKPTEILSLAGGAPLKALAMSKESTVAVLDDILAPLYRLPVEPIGLAEYWSGIRRKNPAVLQEHLVDTIQKWLYDLSRVRHGIAPRYMPGKEKELLAVAQKTSVSRLNRCYSDLLKIRATARHPLNELLFLEDLAARCAIALSLPRP